MASGKVIADIKWNTRQRLQYIELMAYYTGVITRSDVAQTFAISDAAATKDLKLYNDLAPDNLIYKHSVFGFIPGPGFNEIFVDLTPEVALPLIAANLPGMASPNEDSLIYGINCESLPLPTRLPDKSILTQITRAVRHRRKLQISYQSLSDRDAGSERVIEPHALINTGLRWHVRAYSDDTFDFRDFVLSRITSACMQELEAESSPDYDDDWMEMMTLRLGPHPQLGDKKRQGLLIDYKAEGDVIELPVRRALLAYVLHRLSVDTTQDHSLNPNAYQLVLLNRDEIEPYAGWAFMS